VWHVCNTAVYLVDGLWLTLAANSEISLQIRSKNDTEFVLNACTTVCQYLQHLKNKKFGKMLEI